MPACPCIARWSLTTRTPGKSFVRLFLSVQVIREIYDRIYWLYYSILLLEWTGMMYFVFIYLFLAVLGLFWTVVLEKTLESPLDCKEIQPVHPKGNQSWIFIGRTDAESETPILWLPDMKNWLTGKDSDAGRDWGQERRVTTQDEMAGWHHGLDGCESEWTLGDGDGQGGLACCDSWGRKESDMTEWLNWTELRGGQ